MNWINASTFILWWAGWIFGGYLLWKAAWRWNSVDRVFAIPMWLFTRLIIDHAKTHPWHGRRFSLEDWRRGRTILVRQCDLLAWSTLVTIPIILYRLAHL